jgi:hypothetical protein
MAVADWLFYRIPLYSAIDEGVYVRATGPVRVLRSFGQDNSGGTVSVGDVKVKHVPTEICNDLRSLAWGTIDCVPVAHAVIEERDADGELLYRYPGYRPDADRFDTRPLPNVFVGILCGVGIGTVFMFCVFALFVAIGPR